MKLSPYIIFHGNCEEALNFYAEALGGEIKGMNRYAGSPAEEMATDKQKVMHAHFESKDVFFMAADAGIGGAVETTSGMIHMSLSFDDVGEMEKVYNNLSKGAEVFMPLQKTFWGAMFGMLTDKFGVKWMLNCELKK